MIDVEAQQGAAASEIAVAVEGITRALYVACSANGWRRWACGARAGVVEDCVLPSDPHTGSSDMANRMALASASISRSSSPRQSCAGPHGTDVRLDGSRAPAAGRSVIRPRGLRYGGHVTARWVDMPVEVGITIKLPVNVAAIEGRVLFVRYEVGRFDPNSDTMPRNLDSRLWRWRGASVLGQVVREDDEVNLLREALLTPETAFRWGHRACQVWAPLKAPVVV